MPRRASLRDRDNAAIATNRNLPAPAPEGIDTHTDPAPTRRKTQPQTTPKQDAGPSTVSTGGGGARISLYLHPDTYRDTRAAYVVDFEQPNPASSYAEWIAAAVHAHADLQSEERAQLAGTLADIDRAGVGIHRTVKVSEQIQTVMDDARRQDRLAGRVIGRSGFAYEAVLAAIDAARARVGGVLPEPPARLPKNLA